MAGENNEVVLVGRADLENIFQSLKKMNEEATRAEKGIGQLGKNVNETLTKSNKSLENGIKATGSVLRRLANQLYSDFKALVSVESLAAGMKLSNQFKGALSESVKLSDTVRRLGGSFGIAKSEFGKFHGALSRGLGDIGASSEAAANALQGLAGLGVQGQASAMNLSKGAVELAGMSGEGGNEQSIANLLGRAIQATGTNVNDAGAQKAMIGEVTAAQQATGMKASEILQNMETLFAHMSDDLRKKLNPRAMAQMASLSTIGGPGATAALAHYLSMSKIPRMALEAQGFNVIGKNGGLDMNALQNFIKNVKGRTGMDARTSLQTAGFSAEEAEGLVRLGERANDVAASMDKLDHATRDSDAAFRGSMGMLDSFKGAINTVKGRIEEWTGGLSQGITDFLSKQVGSVGGSAAVVGGGALLATILTGGGLRGIGKTLAGGAAASAITGKEVQPVYVVNASEIGGGGGLPGAGGILNGAKNAAGVGLALAGGYAIGEGVNYVDKKLGGGMSDSIVAGFDKLDKVLNGLLSGTNRTPVKVQVSTTVPGLKAKTNVDRGVSN